MSFFLQIGLSVVLNPAPLPQGPVVANPGIHSFVFVRHPTRQATSQIWGKLYRVLTHGEPLPFVPAAVPLDLHQEEGGAVWGQIGELIHKRRFTRLQIVVSAIATWFRTQPLPVYFDDSRRNNCSMSMYAVLTAVQSPHASVELSVAERGMLRNDATYILQQLTFA
jgi:hypothetical protein